MLVAVGENLLAIEAGSVRLHGARGLIREWPAVPYPTANDVVTSWCARESPPRIALAFAGFDDDRPAIGALRPHVELVDARTGETHARSADIECDVLAFSPDGSALYCVNNGVLRAFDDDLRLRFTPAITVGTRPRVTLIEDDDARALVWSTQRLDCIELDKSRVAWTDDVSVVALAAADARAAVATADGALIALDVARGARVRELHRLAPGQTWISVWCDDEIVCALDSTRSLRSFASGGGPMREAKVGEDVHVDVRHRRVVSMERTLAGDIVMSGGAHVRDLDGNVLASVQRASRVCFSSHGAGAAVALVDGRLVEIGGHPIEGPSELVDLASTETGIVALDADGRAQRFDLDEDRVRSRS